VLPAQCPYTSFSPVEDFENLVVDGNNSAGQVHVAWLSRDDRHSFEPIVPEKDRNGFGVLKLRRHRQIRPGLVPIRASICTGDKRKGNCLIQSKLSQRLHLQSSVLAALAFHFLQQHD
jgi:hypothetical protein